MPSANATISATYKDALYYTLSVTSGTGSGNYALNSIVTVTANAPVANKTFDK